MAPHSSTLAWKIPRREEPGRLQSMGSPRVGHDWETSFSLFTSCIGEGNGNPLQCSCLENPRDRAAWWAAVYEVAQSRTRLKRLSSSSSIQVPILSTCIYSTLTSLGGRKPQSPKWYLVQCFEIICIKTNMIFLVLIIRKRKKERKHLLLINNIYAMS